MKEWYVSMTKTIPSTVARGVFNNIQIYYDFIFINFVWLVE